MSLSLQIIIGLTIGLILGFFTIIATINKKEQELILTWNNLSDALNIRYLKLKNVLNFLKNHMENFHSEINKLIEMCDSSIESDPSIKNISKKLQDENNINYTLENIKYNMQNFPSIEQDTEIQSALNAIIESEYNVGEAIRIYNAKNLEYKVLLDTFPISLVAWVLNKNQDEIISFNVASVEEFGDNYIDEDEI